MVAVVFCSVCALSSKSLFLWKSDFITFSATINLSFKSSLLKRSISPPRPLLGSFMISPWTPFSFLNFEFSSPPPCVFGRFYVPKKLFCLVDGVVCSADPAGKKPSYVLKPVLAFSSNSFCSFIYVFFTSYKSKMAFSSSSSANCPFWILTAELVKTEPYFMLVLNGEAGSCPCMELVRFYLGYFALLYK